VGAGGGAQLVDRVVNEARAVSRATVLRGLLFGAGPGNVQHNLELEQLSTRRNRVGPLPGVGGDGRAGCPGLEGVFGLPLGDDEVAIVTLHRAEQLKSEESGLIVDRVGAVGKPFFQLWAGAGRNLDCIDLDHGHDGKVTVPDGVPVTAPDEPVTAQDEPVTDEHLTHCGGTGRPLVLVHGLMGRGSTWARQVPWLSHIGSVYTYDAPWHRGFDLEDHEPISTERFVEELGAAVETVGEPVVLIGHSMGALHSWCLAADRPALVSALVVEDMAPDFVGRTTAAWEPWLHALPEEFSSAAKVVGEFGPLAGRYFLDAFDRTPTGWRLHGRPERWVAIAAEWGTRDYWQQWRAIRIPALLIEAEDSVTPPGQMSRMRELAAGRAGYLRVPGAGHLVHDDAPQAYRAALEAFLAELPNP